jgi:hypothetical protein
MTINISCSAGEMALIGGFRSSQGFFFVGFIQRSTVRTDRSKVSQALSMVSLCAAAS